MALPSDPRPGTGRSALLFQSLPLRITVAAVASNFDNAAISDVAAADFDSDGRADIAVAWFATDNENRYSNLRVLTLYFGNGSGGFTPTVSFNLFVPDIIESLSIFRNGTASLAVGDFDGDGDQDIAVAAHTGDEVWFIENLGGRVFNTFLRFPIGGSNGLNRLTPPRGIAADFNGDGRDELAYLADPYLRINQQLIHFWRTSSTISNMTRAGANWEGTNAPATQETWAMAVADFDGDGRPDLCYSGEIPPLAEPVLVFWHNFNPSTGRFDVHVEHPAFRPSDLAVAYVRQDCRPTLLVTDRDGTSVEVWQPCGDAGIDYARAQTLTGYAALSPVLGMAAAVADLDGDGDPDFVTKQKAGDEADANQIELTLYRRGISAWQRLQPTPIDTTGLVAGNPLDHILRPRNLALADLYGNTLPEIIGGFGPTPQPSLLGDDDVRLLELAIWPNSCLADVTRDGLTTVADLAAMLGSWLCAGDSGFLPDADLDRDGCVNVADLGILLGDLGCSCCGQ